MGMIVDLKGLSMAGELHEISRALGALEANTAALLSGQKELAETVNAMVPTVQSLNQYITAEVKPEIDKLKESRWRRNGIIIALGWVSGVAGTLSPKLGGVLTALFHAP